MSKKEKSILIKEINEGNVTLERIYELKRSGYGVVFEGGKVTDLITEGE